LSWQENYKNTVSYFVITESKLEYIGYLYNWYDF